MNKARSWVPHGGPCWAQRSIMYMLSLSALASCSEPQEAPRLSLPVMLDPTGLEPVESDLGYEVRLDQARLAFKGLTFTTNGELEVALTPDAPRLYSLSPSLLPLLSSFISSAYAHPGHAQGGEVIGELLGELVVDWAQGTRSLGEATLLAGSYDAANFTFRRALAAELPEGDPLIGHTALLAGVAIRGGVSVPFEVYLDSPEGRELIGAPFEADVSAALATAEGSSATISFRFSPLDPIEGDTLFDGVDFELLRTLHESPILTINAQAEEELIKDAYNHLLRAFQTHDHYELSLTSEETPR